MTGASGCVVKAVVMLFILSGIVSVVAATSQVRAAQTIPYKVGFQGRLTDAVGNAKPDGLYNMKIRIFSSASGGTAVGEEVRDGGYRIQVKNGLFSIQIGDNSILLPSVFTNYPLYIEIELPTPATATCATAGCGVWSEGPMSPRSVVASSPTVFTADTIDGIDGSSLVRNDANNNFTGNTTFTSKTSTTDTLSVANGSALGFNTDGYTLQSTDTGAFLSNDTSGLSLSVVPAGTAGSSVATTAVLQFVANNDTAQAVINGGVTNGTNLVANPGFEFGDAGWQYINGTVTSSGLARTGNNILQTVQAVKTDILDTPSNLIAVSPGEKYSYGGYVRVTDTAAGSGGFLMVFYDAQGVLSGYGAADAYIGSLPNTSYNLRTAVQTVPAGAAYAQLFTTMRGDGTAAGTWRFDDVFVRKVNIQNPVTYRTQVNSASAFVIQNAGGGSVLVADTATNTLKVGNGDGGSDNWPALFYPDSKATAGDPSGRNGSMYYNVATKKFRCFEDGGWKDCIASDVITRNTFEFTQDFNQSLNVTSSAFSGNATIIDDSMTAYSNYTGSIVSQSSESNRPGIIRLSSGTRANGNAFVSSNLVTPNPSTQYMFGSGAINYTVSTKIGDLSDASQAYTAVYGLSSDAYTVGSNTGCFFRYSHSINGGNWQGVCSSSGVESVCDLGSLVATNKWYTLRLGVNASGTNVTFVVDEDSSSASCSVTSNITTTVGQSVLNGLLKTNGTSAKTLYIDYVRLQYDLPGR